MKHERRPSGTASGDRVGGKIGLSLTRTGDIEPEYGASHVIVYTSTPPQPSLLDESKGYLVVARCQGCRWEFVGTKGVMFDSEDQARGAATIAGERHAASAARAEAKAAARRETLAGQTVWGFSR